MIAGLRAVTLKELGEKVEAILLKRKKYVMFTKLCQCIRKPSACIVCIPGWLLCNVMGVNSRA